jgi:hypothetical protein
MWIARRGSPAVKTTSGSEPRVATRFRRSGADPPEAWMLPDKTLQHDVLAELEFEPRVNAAHIGVSATNDVVTLDR